MAAHIRILLLADSHLGFDLPERPRVPRRRRGHDFLANYALALGPAQRGEVDVVVHAGDVFDRPGVSTSLAYQALAPLAKIAEAGIPVFIVPGNHERSRLPHHRLASHRNVHVFDRARTYQVEIRGHILALSGFPFEGKDVRTRFPELLARTGWQAHPAAVRLLCLHQCMEGATVGPADFTFRHATDVIRLRDVPAEFSAVLSGHIHRHQVLTTDLQGRDLETPVLYPGSIERTSAAEIGEPKGFMIVHLGPRGGPDRLRWAFRPLPTRPMVQEELVVTGSSAPRLEEAVRALVAAVPADAVLSIRIAGDVAPADLQALSAARLRSFVPDSMNIEIRADALRRRRGPGPTDLAGRLGERVSDPNLQLDLC